MLTIERRDTGEILLRGRWDASETDKAHAFFAAIFEPSVVDFAELEYISSAGLGVLVLAHRRLKEVGGLKLVNRSNHIRDVFRYAGLDRIFENSWP